MTSEKLDILMKITDTKNSALGRALSFDPSYIGRIRTGKRGIPKHMPFIEPAAAFFSRNIKTEYQEKLISEIICKGRALPNDKKKLEALICAWLLEDAPGKPDSGSIDLLLHELSSANPSNIPDILSDIRVDLSIDTELKGINSFFYGNEGKREVTELFLKRLCLIEKPHSLLLFSDEDMAWLYEDPIFAKKWAGYLIKLLSTGSHIKIIHTINRNLNDLMEAIQKWLPLYIIGDIEPYYYPKLRDGIYHRTLFLAKGEYAITSDSIGNYTDDMPNIFINEKKALYGLEKEFNNFLSLCVPLMKIYKNGNKNKLKTIINRFTKSKNEIFFLQGTKSEYANSAKANLIDIDELSANTVNIVKLNRMDKRIPENISILASSSAGITVITENLIFDTTETNFTITFLEYLTNI